MGRTSSLKNKYISLPNNIIAIEDCNANRAYIDIDDLRKISKYTFYKDASGYFRTYINKKAVFLHNLIINNLSGEFVTDHINRCKLDNRKCNLRVVTQKQNCFNYKLSKRNKSGHTGVCFDRNRNKYVATIGKRKIGRFDNLEDAIKARELEVNKIV